MNLAARDRPRRVTRAAVNAELLEALAVQPEHGRWFRREETRAGGPALVMLSHELWQSAFGAREDLVGRTIEIDGVRHEVIGIMPAGFDLMDQQGRVVAAPPARSCASPVSRESLSFGLGHV